MFRKSRTAAIVLLLAAALASAQEKYTLKQSYAPGTYEVKMTMKSEGRTSVAVGTTSQPAVEQKQLMVMTASMVVEPPDAAGVKKVSFTYRRFLQDINAGPMSVRYDSDDPNTASSPMASILKPMMGTKLSVEITADGNFRSVKGMEEIWDAMAKENPRMAAVAEQMKKEFGDEQIRSMMMSSAAGFLSARPVAAGEAWKSSLEIKVPILGAMTQTAQCKLAGVEKGLALVDFDGRGSIDRPTETKIGDTTATVERMSMTQKGRLTFDLAKGMISSLRSTGDVALTMTMDAPNGQKVHTSTVQKVDTEVTISPAPGAETPAPSK